MCTSVPEVREYLAASVESICRAVPELAGFFTITGSENLTNCWSHGNGKGVPALRQTPAGRGDLRSQRDVLRRHPPRGHRAEADRLGLGLARRLGGDIIAQLPREVQLHERERMGHADQARRRGNHRRGILDLDHRPRGAGAASLGVGPQPGAAHSRQGSVRQYLGTFGGPLHPGGGQRRPPRRQPSRPGRQRAYAGLDAGRVSVAQSGGRGRDRVCARGWRGRGPGERDVAGGGAPFRKGTWRRK